MGKASRVRDAKAKIAEIRKEQELKIQAAKKKKKITTIITASVSVMLAVVLLGSLIFLNNAENNGYFIRNKTAVSSENYELDGAQFAYFLNYQYQSFLNDNASYIASYGLDPSVSLRNQETSDGQNWFDYMVSQTQKNINEILLLCEKAKELKIELDDADKKQIDDFFVSIKDSAEASKVSEKEYLAANYGKGVNEKDVRTCLELSSLATKAYKETIGKIEYTDNDILKYFNDNIKDFQMVNYKYYQFAPNTTSEMTTEDANKEQAAVKAAAEKLAKAKTPEEFDSILTDYLKSQGKKDDEIKKAIAATVLQNKTYDSSFEVSKWAFTKAKLYETYTYVNNMKYDVYMLTARPHKDEGETRTVRHILINATEENDKEAKQKAEKILKEFNDGDRTEESFASLVQRYSEDSGSVSAGGLYENFSKGTMVKEFEDWAFDKNRKRGHTEIVKTTYGYHIMYFISVGEPVWKTNVKTAMLDSEYNKMYEELEGKIKITYNNDILDDIPVVRFASQSSGATSSHDHDHDHDHDH